ncbi:hypothetical protein [Streptomyces gardneri]|uniref:Lipoprotein n=1 Tax=Streptomyces gardneri TaxID=66892 RepID=A0A4Y3RVN3_9ACTN|nr:hypothetical protein [Streptomyces gardneri]GEB60803.1 hypothetical protein SGA01_64080 [Streptomyces gardneri]GHH15556.1 hypothetical protein GCM10017674_64810 [Streptomyces gardneri]
MTTTGRRALLRAGAAAGATALAGCTAATDGDGGTRKPSAAELEAERVARAEAALRLRSVTVARGLLERYDAVLAAHPALAPRLTPLRRSVAAHAKALGEGGTTVTPAAASPSASVTAPPSASATASSSVSAGPKSPPVPVAADPRAALKELAAAAREASDRHTNALVTAPPEYARLLASVAAAGAAHAYLLTEGAPA